MNKKELIDALSKKLKNGKIYYPKWELKEIIEPALEIIIEALSQNEEISLRRFGHFSIKNKKGSLYYNINTKKKEIAPDKKIIYFTPYKGFRFQITDKPEPGINNESKRE